MDLRLFATTFVAIFLAELGDKTQLATLAMAAESRARLTIFCASAAALCASSAVAVLGAGLIARYIPALYLTRGAGVMFIVLGVAALFSK